MPIIDAIDFSNDPDLREGDKRITDEIEGTISRKSFAPKVRTITTGGVDLDYRFMVHKFDTSGGAIAVNFPKAITWRAGRSPILLLTHHTGASAVTITTLAGDTVYGPETTGGTTIILYNAGKYIAWCDGLSSWYINRIGEYPSPGISTPAKFLRGDNTWSNTLVGPFICQDLNATGPVTFASTGQRIYLYTSDATRANRTLFTELTTNAGFNAGAIPNGTSNVCAFTMFAANDPDNCHAIQFLTGATSNAINATKFGTGTQRSLELQIGGVTKWTLDTSFNVTAVGSDTATAFIPSGATVPTDGMYLPSASIVGFSANSNLRMSIAAAGLKLYQSVIFRDITTDLLSITGSSVTGGNISLYGSGHATQPGQAILTGNNATNSGSLSILPATKTTAVFVSPGGFGYKTGSSNGGTVTQITSKATGVALSTACGTITTNNAALNTLTIVSFTWTNTNIAVTDTVIMNHVSGGTLGAYTINVAPAAGSATVTLRNNTAANLSEALVLGFAIIKAATN